MGWTDLALYIASERVRRNWAPSDLAGRADVSVRTVEYLERGQRSNYTQHTLIGVEAALGWSVGTVRRIVTEGEPPSHEDKDLARLLASWPRLTVHERSTIATVVEVLAEVTYR